MPFATMSDAECTAFLQWALPRLGLQWRGFRKVHRQLCKRVKRRIADLGLEGLGDYRKRLEAGPQEWSALDQCCHVTISRFFRDRSVFDELRAKVLPSIGERAQRDGRDARCWSAGCASGEEPYTLKIIWDLEVSSVFPAVALSVIATDIDKAVLDRAHRGCYSATSLREMPAELISRGFERVNSIFCVRPQHRGGVTILRQDLRSQAPDGPFDVVLCRNLAFTYFAPELQKDVLKKILRVLRPDGYLVVGAHERISGPMPWFAQFESLPHVLRRIP
jgi:chemotaxis protein methyltransferase CheR